MQLTQSAHWRDKDVGQQGSLTLNFSGGSHGSDQFSPAFFFLLLTKVKMPTIQSYPEG